MREGNSVANKIKRFIIDTKGILFTVIILGLVLSMFFQALSGASEKADSSAAASLENAIKRAAVQCYAIEGFYPPGVDYLEEHYGIIIDYNKFIVEYNCSIPNNLPIIKVLY